MVEKAGDRLLRKAAASAYIELKQQYCEVRLLNHVLLAIGQDSEPIRAAECSDTGCVTFPWLPAGFSTVLTVNS